LVLPLFSFWSFMRTGHIGREHPEVRVGGRLERGGHTVCGFSGFVFRGTGNCGRTDFGGVVRALAVLTGVFTYIVLVVVGGFFHGYSLAFQCSDFFLQVSNFQFEFQHFPFLNTSGEFEASKLQVLFSNFLISPIHISNLV
jgi:hypothetical protein